MMRIWVSRVFLGLLLVAMATTLSSCWADAGPERNLIYDIEREEMFPDPKALALAMAAETGNVEAINRLMKEEGVNPDKIFSPGGFPLLAWPVHTKNPAGLSTIYYKENAMVWAAKARDSVYLKLLLDHGGNPDTRNSNNATLLYQARGHWPSVQLLVQRGADVHAKSQDSTITEDYSWGGFMRVHWLLEHGAGPSAKTPNPPEFETVVEAIYWYPSQGEENIAWQRKCQQWLKARGIERPAMPEYFREMRQNFGYPHEEKDIPLL
jgi:uncharacterized protein